MQFRIQSLSETHSTSPVTQASSSRWVNISAGLFLCLLTLFVVLQFPSLSGLVLMTIGLYAKFPAAFSQLLSHNRFRAVGGWRTIGVLCGTLLFFGILCQADPASAQLFDTAEEEADTIFGDYLPDDIIPFLFGLLRVVIWVSAVGFVFFAVYQAQRGEQWQPLLQNAFIVIAAVVVVEGLSQLFFGTGTGGETGGGTGDGAT
jgi:hypothetical protein